MFYAAFDIGIGRVNQVRKSAEIGRIGGLQFDVAHEAARALKEPRGVGQVGAVKERDIDMRGEDVDGGEGGVAEASHRAAVVQRLADLVAARAHELKPPVGDRSELARTGFEPCVDGGIAEESAVESEEFSLHGR
jgi:hypothetical protein